MRGRHACLTAHPLPRYSSTGAALSSWPAHAAQPPHELERRIQKLEDEKEIRDLLIRYGLMLDGKDYAGYAALFARDAVWIGGFGTHRTPAGIEAMLNQYMGPAKPGRNKDNFHLLTNSIIEVDGDRARAVSKLIFYVKGADGRPTGQFAGHYDDELVREDGRWKFARRVVQGDIPYSDPLLDPPAAKPPAPAAPAPVRPGLP